MIDKLKCNKAIYNECPIDDCDRILESCFWKVPKLDKEEDENE